MAGREFVGVFMATSGAEVMPFFFISMSGYTKLTEVFFSGRKFTAQSGRVRSYL